MKDSAKPLKRLEEIRNNITNISKAIFGYTIFPDVDLSRQLSQDDKQTLVNRACEAFQIVEYSPELDEIATIDDLAGYINENMMHHTEEPVDENEAKYILDKGF